MRLHLQNSFTMAEYRLRVHWGLSVQIAATCSYYFKEEPTREPALVEDSASWQAANWHKVPTSDWQHRMAICDSECVTTSVKGSVSYVSISTTMTLFRRYPGLCNVEGITMFEREGWWKFSLIRILLYYHSRSLLSLSVWQYASHILWLSCMLEPSIFRLSLSSFPSVLCFKISLNEMCSQNFCWVLETRDNQGDMILYVFWPTCFLLNMKTQGQTTYSNFTPELE